MVNVKAKLTFVFFLLVTGSLGQAQTSAASPAAPAQDKWRFAVSGDSRNCGNVVMPAIAAGAKKDEAAFYWHLGDLRASAAPDGDYQHEPEHRGQPPDLNSYHQNEWDDFIQNQIANFDPLPFFVGIGNHETIAPKTRAEFASKFTPWLDSPVLKKQRLADNPQDQQPHTYYHWIKGGVDFIYLDNATFDEFSQQQVDWLNGVLQRAIGNSEVRSVVVGMHQALPESLAASHSMSDWEFGVNSGNRVYEDLLNFHKKTNKPVYLLASHSHFYMSGIYDSDYWRSHGGVLPGWIVGTAGAVRYALPPDAGRAKDARTKIYGYLLGTVHNDGKVDFAFKELKRQDIPDATNQRYTPEFVDYCFNQNIDPRSFPAPAPKK